jgi:hypothetical protein
MGRLEGEEITVTVVVWSQERSLCMMLASRMVKLIVRVFIIRRCSHKPGSSEFAKFRDTYVIDEMTHVMVKRVLHSCVC